MSALLLLFLKWNSPQVLVLTRNIMSQNLNFISNKNDIGDLVEMPGKNLIEIKVHRIGSMKKMSGSYCHI